jgi:C-terminal processing protease CtpA/Prc
MDSILDKQRRYTNGLGYRQLRLMQCPSSVAAAGPSFRSKFLTQIRLIPLSITLLTISACGGGDGGGNNNVVTPGGNNSTTTTWVEGVFATSASFEDLCESPRSGASTQTGTPFPDILGSTLLENNWLRSWTDESYLWYTEVVDRDPTPFATNVYFDLLKTEATTGSGADKDQFHFTIDTASYEALSQSGVSAGYGFQITFLSSSAPYELAIAYTEPDSPAADAGIDRGARIVSIDGADAVNPATQAEVDILNAGLSPDTLGETHSFTVRDLGSSGTRTVNLTSASITSTPVQSVSAVDTASGKVGYILFNDHIATAELQLMQAIEQLAAEPVEDLILDLRYNGGGFLAIASEMAYMIAGAAATNGQVFEQLVFNDKNPTFDPITGELNDPIPFFDTAIGFSATSGSVLPTLDLPRVFILSSSNTCSASESIINSLQGIGVEVILIGDTTCGKPYGFYPADNCGTTYFSIQFQSENALGFSDYADGFSPQNVNSLGSVSLPGCGVADDFDHVLGDPNESILATALAYRETGSCAVSTKTVTDALDETSDALSTNSLVPKSIWLQNRIMDRTND